MDMARFSEANLKRNISSKGFNQSLWSWSASDWMVATLGELGEAANKLKKLNRFRDGIRGNKETEAELRKALADELADTFIYLDLLCQHLSIDLEQAVIEKFNIKSIEIGYPEKLYND